MDERDEDQAERLLAAAGARGLRRAMELLTARRMVAAGLLTLGEFDEAVLRVLLEVGTAGLVELLAAQATLTSILAESLAGDEAPAAIEGVSRLLSLVEQAGVQR